MRLSRVLTVVAGALAVFASLPSCSQTANISEVYASLDKEGERRRESFFTDTEKIYCHAKAGFGRSNVTIEWLVRRLQVYDPNTGGFVGSNIVAGYKEEQSSVTTNGPTLTSVEIVPLGPTGPDEKLPFLAGRGQCEVYLDGDLEGQVAFNINFPPCPPSVIINNTVCAGFYPEGQACPQSGETGQPEPVCRCVQGAWTC